MTHTEVYQRCKAARLHKAYRQVLGAVVPLAEKLEDYPSTPYTKRDADDLTAAARALRLIGEEVRAWQAFVSSDHD